MKHLLAAVAVLSLLASPMALADAQNPAPAPKAAKTHAPISTSFRAMDDGDPPSPHANTAPLGCVINDYRASWHTGCQWVPIRTSFAESDMDRD